MRARENFPEGTRDEEQFEAAIRAERLFLTQDADFLALSVKILSQGRHHPGIVYWPQGTHSLGQVIRRLRQYLATTTSESRKDLVKFL